eukprot:RCo009419
MATYLNDRLLPLTEIREFAKLDLFRKLDEIRGNKVIVWDPTLLGPSRTVVSPTELKQRHQVESMTALTETMLECSCPNVVFFVRPKLRMMKLVAMHVRYLEQPERRDLRRAYHV